MGNSSTNKPAAPSLPEPKNDDERFKFAVIKGDLETAKTYFTKERATKRNSWKGVMPAMHVAAYWGQVGIIQWLHEEHGLDLDELDTVRPLHQAAKNGQLKTVQWLIGHGVDVDTLDKEGRQAIHFAAWLGHLAVVRWLHGSAGADVNAKETRPPCQRPIHFACTGNHVEVVKYLHKQGADLKVEDSNGWTPFKAATNNDHERVAKYLREKGGVFQ